MTHWLLIILSFFICALAQPDWSATACIIATSCGYALFWKGLLHMPSKKMRFFVSCVWFALISAVHLNWFFADRYVGLYIYPFLFLLFLMLGAQFGCVCLLIGTPKKMGLWKILGISGIWTLLEWGRLFLLSGFSWDPVGLALSGTLSGMQLAAVVGLYGMSFWIFFTNFVALRLFSRPSWKGVLLWAVVAICPYLFGFWHLSVHTKRMESDTRAPLSALLVQTALAPEEKVSINGSKPLSPLVQWERILNLVKPQLEANHDVIVLPEGVVPYGTDLPIYPQRLASHLVRQYFKEENFEMSVQSERVGNRFFAQKLADSAQTDVILGLEDSNRQEGSAYNAAFFIRPFSESVERYEKRVLVPMGEYIPFNWCKRILSRYGISDSFTAGKNAKVFQSKHALFGISICYEETYGHLMRQSRRQGAEVLVNLTNDVWYPRSRLPVVHFLHGRLRAVESGAPLLRACNTGVTCGIDSLGRIVDSLPYECARTESVAATLPVLLPLYSYSTLYSLWGDWPVILFSGLVALVLCAVKLSLKFRSGHLR